MAVSVLVTIVALVPTFTLILRGVLELERRLWMDFIADSLARAVLEEARVTQLRR